jgi:hypothetical protein
MNIAFDGRENAPESNAIVSRTGKLEIVKYQISEKANLKLLNTK